MLLQELTTARMEHSKVQTALMAKDAELERRNVEIGSLQSDKSSLDKLLQVGEAGAWLEDSPSCSFAVRHASKRGSLASAGFPFCCQRLKRCRGVERLCARAPRRVLACVQEKQSEISELQTRLAAAADKNVALTEANAALDAKLHEAQATASRSALTQSRLQQEKEIMEKTNAWLSQVSRRSGAGAPCAIRSCQLALCLISCCTQPDLHFLTCCPHVWPLAPSFR